MIPVYITLTSKPHCPETWIECHVIESVNDGVLSSGQLLIPALHPHSTGGDLPSSPKPWDSHR